jgi:hypothetical protein
VEGVSGALTSIAHRPSTHQRVSPRPSPHPSPHPRSIGLPGDPSCEVGGSLEMGSDVVEEEVMVDAIEGPGRSRG